MYPRIKKYYDYILSYSPYDQITDTEYPNLLVTSGYYDSQVQYWEPLREKIFGRKSENFPSSFSPTLEGKSMSEIPQNLSNRELQMYVSTSSQL